MDQLRSDVDMLMRERHGMFDCNRDRDRCICLVAFALIAYVVYCWWMQSQAKESLDNRSRWMLGSQRDDTGATNPASMFASGYGLEQSKKGSATLQEGVQFGLGRSAIAAGGFKQTEYSGTLGPKEGLDSKEKLGDKTTENNLQKKLYGQ
jgi:hypothetical protein